jgi:hypothetical protein
MNTPSNPKAFFCLLTLDATERILDAVRINKQEKLVFGSSDQECDVVLPASPHPRFLSIRIRHKWFTIHPECGNEVQFDSHGQSLTSTRNDPSTISFHDVFSICGQRFKVVDRRPDSSVRVRVRVRRRTMANKRETPYPPPNHDPNPRDSMALPPKIVSKDEEDKENIRNLRRDIDTSYKGSPEAVELSRQYIAIFDNAATSSATPTPTATATATATPRSRNNNTNKARNGNKHHKQPNNRDDIYKASKYDINDNNMINCNYKDEDEDEYEGEDGTENCFFGFGVGVASADECDEDTIVLGSFSDIYRYRPYARVRWENKRIFLK